MRFKLWDTTVSTLFGVYPREEEAMTLVRTLLSNYGSDMADDLELIVEPEEGEPRGNFSGAALVARAEECHAQAVFESAPTPSRSVSD